MARHGHMSPDGYPAHPVRLQQQVYPNKGKKHVRLASMCTIVQLQEQAQSGSLFPSWELHHCFSGSGSGTCQVQPWAIRCRMHRYRNGNDIRQHCQKMAAVVRHTIHTPPPDGVKRPITRETTQQPSTASKTYWGGTGVHAAHSITSIFLSKTSPTSHEHCAHIMSIFCAPLLPLSSSSPSVSVPDIRNMERYVLVPFFSFLKTHGSKTGKSDVVSVFGHTGLWASGQGGRGRY